MTTIQDAASKVRNLFTRASELQRLLTHHLTCSARDHSLRQLGEWVALVRHHASNEGGARVAVAMDAALRRLDTSKMHYGTLADEILVIASGSPEQGHHIWAIATDLAWLQGVAHVSEAD